MTTEPLTLDASSPVLEGILARHPPQRLHSHVDGEVVPPMVREFVRKRQITRFAIITDEDAKSKFPVVDWRCTPSVSVA